jgi:type I restriction enzyme, S subunit
MQGDLVALDGLCKRITDGSHWSPTSVEVGRPMASSKDMRRWDLDLSKCRKISEADYESLVRNDCQPLAGDVLITKDGANYLKYCFAVERDMNVVLLSSVAILRPDSSKLSSHYLSFCLTNPETKARLSGRVSGAAIPRIVLKDFREFTIPVPSPAIQDEFDRMVGPYVMLCRRLVQRNENLRTTRDLLLPKLVSGEVSVEQIEEEALAETV